MKKETKLQTMKNWFENRRWFAIFAIVLIGYLAISEAIKTTDEVAGILIPTSSPIDSLTISGMVFDLDNSPLENVKIEVINYMGAFEYTDSYGMYSVSLLRPTNFDLVKIRYSRTGYKTIVRGLSLQLLPDRYYLGQIVLEKLMQPGEKRQVKTTKAPTLKVSLPEPGTKIVNSGTILNLTSGNNNFIVQEQFIPMTDNSLPNDLGINTSSENQVMQTQFNRLKELKAEGESLRRKYPFPNESIRIWQQRCKEPLRVFFPNIDQKYQELESTYGTQDLYSQSEAILYFLQQAID